MAIFVRWAAVSVTRKVFVVSPGDDFRTRKAVVVSLAAVSVTRKVFVVSWATVSVARKVFVISWAAVSVTRKAVVVGRAAFSVARKVFVVGWMAIFVGRATDSANQKALTFLGGAVFTIACPFAMRAQRRGSRPARSCATSSGSWAFPKISSRAMTPAR